MAIAGRCPLPCKEKSEGEEEEGQQLDEDGTALYRTGAACANDLAMDRADRACSAAKNTVLQENDGPSQGRP